MSAISSTTRRSLLTLAATAGAIGLLPASLRATTEDDAIRTFTVNFPETDIVDLRKRACEGILINYGADIHAGLKAGPSLQVRDRRDQDQGCEPQPAARGGARRVGCHARGICGRRLRDLPDRSRASG